jgi:hypothetical protein
MRLLNLSSLLLGANPGRENAFSPVSRQQCVFIVIVTGPMYIQFMEVRQ